MAIEGTGITLLGLIRYNSDLDTIEMTELWQGFAGNMQEFTRYCALQYEHLSANFNLCLIVGCVSGLSAAVAFS